MSDLRLEMNASNHFRAICLFRTYSQDEGTLWRNIDTAICPFASRLTYLLFCMNCALPPQIQTSPLDTPLHNLSLYQVGKAIADQHGWRRLFRGMGITLVRAFPVNGTIFPVYEFTLMQMNQFSASS